ncbi:MAG: DUF4179 domain-containing protein [Oscillospiraceae bacterium]|nr:DUF4179 domain-containing protein [Oscillospiraceae bacterium]
MNRMEELEQLRAASAPAGVGAAALALAQKRLRRRRHLLQPAAALAASFAVFVALVNFCAPVAYACAKVPVLRELASAVTFSPSLGAAVENNYVQPIGQTQTDGEVTAAVESVIVDQKQVTVFYRLASARYAKLCEQPGVYDAEGGAPAPCSYGPNGWDVENGTLRSTTIDFVEDNVPTELLFTLDVWEAETEAPAEVTSIWDDTPQQPESLAHFAFLLSFDPEFRETGTHLTLDQTVVLDGQKITITDLEIYPSHLRVNMADDPNNTAWLKELQFYIETDWGMKFEPIANGITATGSLDSPMMNSYRADSTYFHQAKHLKLVITGAQWLDKSMEKISVDLASGTASAMPQGTVLESAKREDGNWIITVQAETRKKNAAYQVFSQTYYDPSGAERTLDRWTSGGAGEVGDCFETQFPLLDYPYDTVTLMPSFSRWWTAAQPVTVTIQ